MLCFLWLNIVRNSTSFQTEIAADRMPALVVQTSLEVSRPRQNVLFSAEVRTVQNIEPFGQQLQIHALAEPDPAADAQISEAKSNPRPVLRPTPKGRSLLLVSRLRSVPSSTLNGNREPYVKMYPN